MWVPPRRRDPEWLDRSDNPREAVEAALEDVRLTNRLLGGRRVLLRAVEPFVAGGSPSSPVEILDVGTGAGDLPVALVRMGRRHGREVRVTAVDLEPSAVGLAARATAAFDEIRIVRADACRPPFRERSFDLVTASMFLHHFDQDTVVRLLRRYRRLARRAVVVNDLRRHRAPWAFIALAARVTRRSAMYRHDAPLSVLRGFTEDELLAAARDVSADRALVRRRWPFRLVLTLPAGGPP